jgi:hypothetical protein
VEVEPVQARHHPEIVPSLEVLDADHTPPVGLLLGFYSNVCGFSWCSTNYKLCIYFYYFGAYLTKIQFYFTYLTMSLGRYLVASAKLSSSVLDDLTDIRLHGQ